MDLKVKCGEASKVNAKEMKLIYKGKILKDDDLLATLNLSDGVAMHMVHTKPLSSESH